MFCRLKLRPQNSLLSQVFLHNSTRCHSPERRGGGGMFLLSVVCEHLINVNTCCCGRCFFPRNSAAPCKLNKEFLPGAQAEIPCVICTKTHLINTEPKQISSDKEVRMGTLHK